VTPEEIKERIKEQFASILKAGQETEISGIEEDSYGHSAGTPFEEWVKSRLTDNGWIVYYPNEFVVKLCQRIDRRQNLIEVLRENWWSSLLVRREQINDCIAGKRVGRWQQEGADLVLLYGDDLLRDSESVILLNVKSHNIIRKSRPPNIMSGQRLLQFFHEILVKRGYKTKLERLEIWFIGIGYVVENSNALIQEVYVKDLFKLDASKIPQINFDAAIQIQWHVKDMVEKDQSKTEFIRDLCKTFLMQWKKHAKNKEEKYIKLVTEIDQILSK